MTAINHRRGHVLTIYEKREGGTIMWEICIVISGKRHCFPLPILVEKFHTPGPGPVNFPELELATTVLELVTSVQPQIGQSQFAKQLVDSSTHFIQQVQKGLPSGVELHQAGAQ